MSADVAHEVRIAEREAEGWRLHEDIFRRRASPTWQADAEAVIERACIQAEPNGPARGLSKSPTSGKKASTARVEAEAVALRAHVGGLGGAARLRARLALMRRSVGVAARGHDCARARDGFRPDRMLFLTLTYEVVEDWHAMHIAQVLRHCRQWLKREHGAKLRYVWVAELQKRGAVHYHVVLYVPHGVRVPHFDECGWWPHGSSNLQVARDSVAYLMKYLSKGTDVDFPKGLRSHGAGGLEVAIRRAKRWLRLPGFIKARSDIWDDWRPAKGGGWYDPDGFHFPAEFERAWLGDRWGCVRVCDYGRPFDPQGPFSWIDRGPYGA